VDKTVLSDLAVISPVDRQEQGQEDASFFISGKYMNLSH
jgi:hypothetical protein